LIDTRKGDLIGAKAFLSARIPGLVKRLETMREAETKRGRRNHGRFGRLQHEVVRQASAGNGVDLPSRTLEAPNLCRQHMVTRANDERGLSPERAVAVRDRPALHRDARIRHAGAIDVEGQRDRGSGRRAPMRRISVSIAAFEAEREPRADRQRRSRASRASAGWDQSAKTCTKHASPGSSEEPISCQAI